MKQILSVIIPTYKRTYSLKRLLQLLQGQTIIDALEILVIDQNGKDFLESEIEISSFLNVRHVWQEQPNASLARNSGALLASGDYLVFLDDDLIPENDFCEKGIAFFTRNEFIQCFTPWIKDERNTEDSLINIKQKIVHRIHNYLYEITDTISAVVFFRKEAFLRSGGFDVLLFSFAKTAEDQEFFLRLQFKDIRLYYTNSFSVFHDEFQSGGCDLRTVDYWITREKCIRAWVFRFKIFRGKDLKLTLSDFISLYRSVFFNSKGLTSGLPFIKRQIKLFNTALIETDELLSLYKDRYSKPSEINHFNL